MNAKKIKNQRQLINFIKDLNLNDLFVSEVNIKFNRDKYLEDAKRKGKTVECFQVVGEEFTDDYWLTNIDMLTDEDKFDYELLRK